MGSAPAASATVPAFVVSGGAVQGPQQIPVRVGSEVVFTVTTDTNDEVHVHGYDLHVPTEAGKPATVRLDAGIPGVFEVELHDSGRPVTQLRVSP